MKKVIYLRYIFLFFLSSIVCHQADAQNQGQKKIWPFGNRLKVEFIDSKLSQSDTSIVIRYHLKGYKRRYYNTQLFYSNNSGNSFKGPLRSLSGDIGDSTRVGEEKEINWSFRKDNPYFDGKNIMFKIEATEVPKIATGGPENAFRSMLIPGFGDTKVRNGYNYGWITAVTYACLGTGAFYHFRAKNKYNDYKDRVPNTTAEHDALFRESQNSQRVSTGFLIAVVVIWRADIIGVYSRGLKNKRKTEREKAAAEGETASSSPITWPRIIPNTDGKTSQITLAWKF